MIIEKGKSTAIVGESGSGKSTLISLMQNLYPLSEGSIFIGDYDLKYINNNSLRETIGVVPQHIDLFAGSVIENIAIGDSEPDMQKILSLSHLTGVNDFIEKLPNTYHTFISEQGVNFSGGERQRLAIARALYRNPGILILDEATSNLDPASENQIRRVLDWYSNQGKTIIIIAHRLSTIKSCDTILVLQNGVLAECGTHETLLAAQNVYARLWQYHTGNI
jgi:ATP-binding cassette subfamily B protein